MAGPDLNSPMRTFDPVKVADAEKEAWVVYYQRRWFRLLRMLFRLVQSTFGLPFWRVPYTAYLLTRAQVAFAPKDNDVPLAEACMREFFDIVKRTHHEAFDPARAAQTEVNWWVVHRQFFGRSDNDAVVDAVAQAYAAAYGVDPASVREAAYYRAQAMVHSDQWVKAGLPANSPLLAQEQEELRKSYAALRRAIGP